MVMATKTLTDLLDPIFREIALNKYKAWKPIYNQIFNVQNSTRATEKDSFVIGLGAMEVKSERAGITYSDFTQGYDYTYTPVVFAKGAIVSEELYEDDQHNIIKKIPAELARIAQINIEVETANIFNRAFNSSYVFGDGKELCATDHPNPKGGSTLRNELSTPADLSVTSLKQALIDWENQVDYNGFPIMIDVKTLYIPTDLIFDAKEILKSERLANTANNNINSLRDYGLDIIVGKYLTDTDAWFLLSPKDQHSLNMFFRRHPKMRNFPDNDNGDMKSNISQRFSVGASGFFGVFGSPGA